MSEGQFQALRGVGFVAAHHSDQTFTASTGLRFHPGELLLSLRCA